MGFGQPDELTRRVILDGGSLDFVLAQDANGNFSPVDAAATFTDFVLVDGSRDITGTQRFAADPAAIFGAAGDTQVRIDIESSNAIDLEVAGNDNAFSPRLRFNASDHPSPHDIILFDGDGVTARLRWDQSTTTWDFSATTRFAADPPAIFGPTGDSQLRIDIDSSNAIDFDVAGNDNVFKNRMRFNASDHATAADDILFYDGDGSTARLWWDESTTLWRYGASVYPATDNAWDLGGDFGTAAWQDLRVYNVRAWVIFDETGATRIDLSVPRIIGDPILFGAGGDTQGRFEIGTETFNFGVAGNDNVFTPRIRFRASDHGSEAFDILFLDGDGLTERLRWDDSLTSWVFNARILPASDLAYDIGSATLAIRDFYVEEIHDESANLALDTSSPRGATLAGTDGMGQATSITAPGASPTYANVLSRTITLERSAQPVAVYVWATVRCTDIDENEGFQGHIEIDGNDGPESSHYVGNVTDNLSVNNDTHSHSHSHNTQSPSVTGTSGPQSAGTAHTHTAGSYAASSHSHGNDATDDTHNHGLSGSVNVADGEVTIPVEHFREFTPAGASFDIHLQVHETGGATAWEHAMRWQVFRA